MYAFISISSSFTVDKFSFFSLGITSRLLDSLAVPFWVMIVASEWDFFSPFCVESVASKLSDTL